MSMGKEQVSVWVSMEYEKVSMGKEPVPVWVSVGKEFGCRFGRL